ncbi:hypothetical protein SELMODRAFT_421197 [Selaginella moellendorffii]|uniref:F-box associated domain-containing protein n=1 Tax=Selaginella moellendorffii TaxID=88036 RepID=D8SEB7_SELML|nr:hypothetical protein SELMODRAFT_421197 [Selaginella moellendorffii]
MGHVTLDNGASSNETEQSSANEEGATRLELEDDQSQGQSSQRMVKLPYEIQGHLTLPCPTGDPSDEWGVMCCREGFVLMYCRKLGKSHLFDLCKGTDHPITWMTNISSNPQMVFFKDNIYVAADFRIQKYNLRLDKWSVQQRFPLGCNLERLLVLQDGIVGVFKRESFPYSGIQKLVLEWRFLDLDYKGVNKKGWRQPFAEDIIEDGVMPAMATLNKVVLVMMKWFQDSNANWLYFWNEDKSEWEFLDGKLEGGRVSELVVVGDNQLHAYDSQGALVSKSRVHWDSNGQISSVKWV